MILARRPFCSLRTIGLLVCMLLAWLAVGGAVQAQAEAARAPSVRSAAVAADDLRVELRDLLPQNRLVGKSRFSVWGFDVYDARLWADPDFQPGRMANQTFALELAYLRDFNSLDIAQRSISEMGRSASIAEAQANQWIQDMRRVIPDIKKGDRVMGIHRPGVGALFLVNGKTSGEIPDAEFARLFFGIWLSPRTSEPKLRQALLAGAGG